MFAVRPHHFAGKIFVAGVMTYVQIVVNTASTVHAALIVPVVYVLPANDPPQPATARILYPAAGVTVKLVVVPISTCCVPLGLIDPFDPATDVTATVEGANVALTVQATVMTPVVYVLPTRAPPQPVTASIL